MSEAENQQNTPSVTSVRVEGVVMRHHWLPGWYATRLHAVADGTELPKGQACVQARCGAWVYGQAPTDWAQRRMDKGIAHCKRCAKLAGA